MKKEILFSIVMPTYNRPTLLKRSIENILKSTYKNYEIIVVNDGGGEDSESIVEGFNSDKIQYFWKENEQKGIAKNFGFSKAKGDYLLSFDDDDIMYENFLQTAYDKIVENNYPELYYQSYEVIGMDEEHISYPKKIDPKKMNIFSGNPFSNNGMIIRSDVCELPLYLPRKDFTLSADWLLWIKLLHKYKCIINNEITHGVTVHENRGSASGKVAQYENNLQIFETELIKNGWGTPRQLKRAIGYYNTYVSLFLTLGGVKRKGIKYLLFGIIKSPKEIFSRRFLAIIKHMMLSKK